MDDKQKAIELAEEHWEFLERWLEMIFKDGFIHGYKHGVKDAGNEEVLQPFRSSQDSPKGK